MFVVFKCDCGTWQYQDDKCKTRQCPNCNKVNKLKNRRVFGKARNASEARALLLKLKAEELGLEF